MKRLFQRASRWARYKLRQAVLNLIAGDMVKLRYEAVDQTDKLLSAKLSALQAIDLNFHEVGRIILIARVAGRDIVKVIETPPHWTLDVWQQTVHELESRYGASRRIVDMPARFGRHGDADIF